MAESFFNEEGEDSHCFNKMERYFDCLLTRLRMLFYTRKLGLKTVMDRRLSNENCGNCNKTYCRRYQQNS